MLEEAIASVTRPDLPPLGTLPRRRRLHQPRDHHRPQTPRHPDPRIHLTRHDTRPRHLRRHQRRPRSSPPATTSPCSTTTTPSPPTPCNTSPTRSPRQPDLDMIYTDEDIIGEGGPDRAPSQAGLVAGAHRRADVHVPPRGLPAVAGRRPRRLSARFDGCQDYDFVLRLIGAHRPGRAHPRDPLPLARARRLHRRRRAPSRTPTSPSRARSPPIWSAAASTPRSSSASSPGCTASSIG